MEEPRTRYTTGREPSLAYQVLGEGSGVDVVVVGPLLTHVEHSWSLPTYARALRRLAALGRLVHYDRRNVGLSDPSPGAYTIADEAEDLVAVMDAAGVTRPAAIVSLVGGGPVACVLAAVRPERVGWIVLDNCQPRVVAAHDYTWAPTAQQRAAASAKSRTVWGDGERIAYFAPDLASDPEARAWMGRMERLATSPATMQRVNAYMNDTDVRGVLESVRAPTLVVRRRDDAQIDRRHALHLIERIGGAVLEEQQGRDTLPFGASADAWADLVGRFVTGRPPPSPPTRALATLLFTDIVDSTATLTRLGDASWRAVLEDHDRAANAAVRAAGGVLVKSLGDGVFARFDKVPDAVTAARDLIAWTPGLGVEIRAGVHVGDCELVGDDLAGRTVHEAARIAALAGPGELLVSDAARGLLAGAGIETDDRGLHALKGFEQPYRVWCVRAA